MLLRRDRSLTDQSALAMTVRSSLLPCEMAGWVCTWRCGYACMATRVCRSFERLLLFAEESPPPQTTMATVGAAFPPFLPTLPYVPTIGLTTTTLTGTVSSHSPAIRANSHTQDVHAHPQVISRLHSDLQPRTKSSQLQCPVPEGDSSSCCTKLYDGDGGARP